MENLASVSFRNSSEFCGPISTTSGKVFTNMPQVSDARISPRPLATVHIYTFFCALKALMVRKAADRK